MDFQDAAGVSMELKEQVKILQHDHEKMLKIPARGLDGFNLLVRELCRRKSEVGRLKKRVRLLKVRNMFVRNADIVRINLRKSMVCRKMIETECLDFRRRLPHAKAFVMWKMTSTSRIWSCRG